MREYCYNVKYKEEIKRQVCENIVTLWNKTRNRLSINNIYVDNHQEIAKEFNNFFTKIGQEILDSVKPTKVTAESFLHEDPSIPELELKPIRPSQIVKLMVSKNSTDSNRISSNLIKKIIYEISVPLAHIFS